MTHPAAPPELFVVLDKEGNAWDVCSQAESTGPMMDDLMRDDPLSGPYRVVRYILAEETK